MAIFQLTVGYSIHPQISTSSCFGAETFERSGRPIAYITSCVSFLLPNHVKAPKGIQSQDSNQQP